MFKINKKGTADAVKTAIINNKNRSSVNTLVIYGDTPLIKKRTLNNALRKFRENNLDLCVISMMPDKKENSYGKLKFSKKKISRNY